MELLADEPPLTLDDPAWPILTMGLQRPPARIEGSATIDGCLVAGGSHIRGTVARSVIGPGVVVEEGPRFETPSSSMTAMSALARV